MDDKFVKYSKLYVLIFLAFLAVPVAFGMVVGSLYGFSKLISSRPVDMFFELLVVAVPAAIFCTAYFIFFKRTKKHPSQTVRGISYLFFIIGIGACLYFLVLDIISFFTLRGHTITDYKCFHQFFLAGNIGGLFLIAILQALSTEKETDWMEKAGRKYPPNNNI